MSEVSLSRDELRALLEELGEDLAGQGVRAELFLVGGAAIALAFNARRLTADVDGVFEPKVLVYTAAGRVAARHDIAPDWLNDAVKGMLPGPDPDARELLNLPGLRVSVASPRYLLALKVQAARMDRDTDDIRLLAQLCGATTADQVLAIAEQVIGAERLLPKAQFVVQHLFPQPTAGGE